MDQQKWQLRKSDRAEITVLADNYTDVFLSSTEKVKRPPHVAEGNVLRGLLADHGLSVLVDVFEGSSQHRFLFDTGHVPATVPWNVESLGLCLQTVEAVVIGHGHHDHFGGLIRLYQDDLIPRTAPLHVHPEVFSQRFVDLREEGWARMPQLTRTPLNHLGVRIHENRKPSLLPFGLALLTGEVERVTDFECGFPPGRRFEDGEIRPDTMVPDEQALILNIKNKGLVIISSCGHPGIINTILYARTLTGERKVYFVIGGLHLSGKIFEPVIEPTMTEMKKLAPEMLAPCHCTGWKAVNCFAAAMPDQFVLNSVGTRYVL
jgi:7,8-dihydropterin-6-yl-methyl-4-(beta-D-ribofuranosyl)aminobenzene 5'-phosphate synthase